MVQGSKAVAAPLSSLRTLLRFIVTSCKVPRALQGQASYSRCLLKACPQASVGKSFAQQEGRAETCSELGVSLSPRLRHVRSAGQWEEQRGLPWGAVKPTRARWEGVPERVTAGLQAWCQSVFQGPTAGRAERWAKGTARPSGAERRPTGGGDRGRRGPQGGALPAPPQAARPSRPGPGPRRRCRRRCRRRRQAAPRPSPPPLPGRLRSSCGAGCSRLGPGPGSSRAARAMRSCFCVRRSRDPPPPQPPPPQRGTVK